MMGTTYQRRRRRAAGLGNWRLIRYADDLVLMVSGTQAHAEALRDQVQQVLAPIGLRLSASNTRVCHIEDGIEFLGFRIQRKRKRVSHQRDGYVLASAQAIPS